MAADDASSDSADFDAGNRAGLEQRLDIVVAPSHPAAVLMVVSGANPGRLHSLDRPETYVGRSKDTHIRIDEKSVSGRHAKIINHGDNCYIQDLDSTNGTFVNGQPIREKQLKHGDSVWVGETVFAFFQEGGGDSSRTVALATANEDSHPPPGRLAKRPIADAVRGGGEVGEEASFAENIARLIKVYRFLKQYRFMLALFALGGLVLGAASIVFVPPPQVASCEVALRPDPKNNPVENEWRQRSDQLEFFASAETNFSNGELVKKTLAQLGESSNDSKVAAIASRLELKAKGAHQYVGTFHKGYLDPSTYTAVAFLQTYVKNYLDTEIEKVVKVFRAEAGFLHDQLDLADKQLADIEGELLKFKEENIAALPEQTTGTVSSRFELAGRSGQLAAQIARSQQELKFARDRLNNEEPIAESKAAATQPYETALASVNQRLGEARASGLGEEHPQVQQLKRQAEELQKMINSKVGEQTTDFDRKANPAYKALRDRVQDLEMEVQTSSQELGSVQQSLSHVDKVVAKMPEIEARLHELTRSQDAAQQLRARLFEQLKKAELQVDLERSVAAARYEMIIPPSPVNPGRLKTAALRLGGGFTIFLFLGLGIAIVRELKKYVRDYLSASVEE